MPGMGPTHDCTVYGAEWKVEWDPESHHLPSSLLHFKWEHHPMNKKFGKVWCQIMVLSGFIASPQSIIGTNVLISFCAFCSFCLLHSSSSVCFMLQPLYLDQYPWSPSMRSSLSFRNSFFLHVLANTIFLLFLELNPCTCLFFLFVYNWQICGSGNILL